MVRLVFQNTLYYSPYNIYEFEVWAIWRPIKNIYSQFFNIDLGFFGIMCWGVVMLENKVSSPQHLSRSSITFEPKITSLFYLHEFTDPSKITIWLLKFHPIASQIMDFGEWAWFFENIFSFKL